MFEHGLGEHCFRGGWVSQFFRSSKSGSVVARDLSAKSHWLVLCRFHSLEPTKTSQAIPSVSFARLVLWVFMQLEMWGGADPNLRRSLEFAVSSLSPARRQVPLGSSGALREGNASRPPARRSTR